MYAVVLTVAFLGFAADRGYQMLMNRMLQWREQDAVTPDRDALDAPAPSLAHTLLWGFARVFSILALVVAWEASGAQRHVHAVRAAVAHAR